MQEMGFEGEWAWCDVWGFYSEWFYADEKLAPLPDAMKAMFANELGKLCQKGQVRVRENGRVRRLTTYTIPNVGATEAVRLRRAA